MHITRGRAIRFTSQSRIVMRLCFVPAPIADAVCV
jgi:hypothetical protein